MQDEENRVRALRVYELTQQKLIEAGITFMEKQAKDGQPRAKPFVRKGDRFMKIRILPVSEERKPDSFWAPGWCFYEIGLGTFEADAMRLGKVQFCIYPNMVECGEGRYTAGVTDVLKQLAPDCRGDFFLQVQKEPDASSILCGFHYRARKGQLTFPVEQAAEDLAWLIQETLPKFQALR